ncbi:MAG: 50S ribosomal protein L3, partial [Acidimicrobiales bacterium]
MFKAILGYKKGMTRIFDPNGVAVPVTVIEAGPCTITQIKKQAKDGYSAVQLGFGDVKPKSLSRAELGHLKRSGGSPVRHLKEFRVDAADGLKVGATVDCGVFEVGHTVNVTGISRGLGMAGTIKRHH